MLKNKIKRWLPDRQQLSQHKSLKVFGSIIHNGNLWHLNRYSVPAAFSVGLFCAWIPVPFQMILAAAGAVIFQANLPLSVALVWLTNPVTMPPLFFIAYKVGVFFMGAPAKPFNFNISAEWLLSTLNDGWKPFLLGCGIMAIASAIVGNIIIRMLWRYFTIRSWRARSLKRKKK